MTIDEAAAAPAGAAAPPTVTASRPMRVVPAGATPAQALELMARAHVRHLPVVRHGRCVGVLVDRDVMEATLLGDRRPVAALARRPVPAVAPDAGPAEVARAVLAGRLDVALVVEDGELAGIVTTTDLLVSLAATAPS